MNIVDAIIIVFFMIGILDGIRCGAIKSFVGFVGSILVFLLSWMLKGSLANVLIKVLPQIGGNAAISVLVYYTISFIILFMVFSLIYRIVLKLTNVVEKVMDATIILGFVSRVIGAIFGFIKSYIFVFIVLFVLSIFNFSFVRESKISNFILNKTPIFGEVVSDIWDGVKEVYDSNNVEESLKILFEKNIINEKNLNKLINKED